MEEEISAIKGPPVYSQTERARLVGAIKWVHQVVRRYKGDKYPIITLLERVLSVLACKEAKKRGKFKFIDSGNPLTTEMIVERIVRRRHEFEARNMKKEEKEVKILELYHSDLNV
nr:hypothetical protein BaRGS_000390 [Batillaria attramentaria]